MRGCDQRLLKIYLVLLTSSFQGYELRSGPAELGATGERVAHQEVALARL